MIWTPEEVEKLQKHQNNHLFHPYTCGNRDDGNHPKNEGILVPTVRGWICQFCDYKQDLPFSSGE